MKMQTDVVPPDSAPRRLLIIACTATKRPDAGLLPAIDRYDGPSFRVLRRWQADHPDVADSLAVYVLSAEYGLIPASLPIADYNRRMTAARADELREPVQAALQQVLTGQTFAAAYLSGGQVYRRALGEPLPRIGGIPLETAPAGAGIGTQLAALKRWLQSV